ncbi:MAG: type II toxin-antitoxin system RelE/ParE family toxin [Candidatus Omnitrophica bacterium]|nr:type II toxin-antitoxin system RelE/ParE family toxin [Candidatus Omnitrophota bacterium]MBU4473548.1 type II toxin-antitoxin system RelE/ParE family toxin [Candidatus Omnitrophota bacterium]
METKDTQTPNYSCFYFTTESGKSPVEEFISSLDEKTQEKFIFKKELLEQLGSQLRQPHTDKIGGGIFELRFKGEEGQIRILFFFYEKKIILLHGFVKKTQKTPRNEIKIAEQRQKEFLNKHREG